MYNFLIIPFQGKRPGWYRLLSDCIGILSILLILPAVVVKAQSLSIVASESKLWIEGRSTIGEYTCIAHNVAGYALFNAGRLSGERPQTADRDSSGQAHLTMTVRSFYCGKE